MKMLRLILQNLFRGSVTVPFPARPAVNRGYRGLVQFEASRCTGCSMCAFHCTSRAITFRNSKADYKWGYDPAQCTFCGACVDGCDSQALSMEQNPPPVYFNPGALRVAYTMQRKPPAAKPTQPAESVAGGTR